MKRPRIHSRREAWMQKEKEKQEARNAKILKRDEKNTKNAFAGSSRAAQNTPEPYSVVGLSTSSTAPATSAVPTRWVRFWSAVCCISAQNAIDHH
ncbi:hypothetical protein M405DRAFT_823128 [Rhizopogon salebrosus TDB-379]|nr:hypothetical protein M405DRAFT_823128 [Rhizopogon salebrosus TDB-379]